ncbi:uncharacterized protein LOC122662957 [Telopea speciosissima]|uniref:uncharacterized protein LOC122662957 n=1 Tax=Telopea speciosissima TaxID=54955 RepID=UPI001CC4D441|nr:uncharacterized protein LOC122662957 [Telopea speciosissima]
MVDARLVMSYLWQKMIQMQLATNMRATHDSSFSEFVLRVGNGEEQTESEGLKRIPDEMLIQYRDLVEAEEELIKTIFLSLHEKTHSTEYIKEWPILATKNEIVDKLNEKLIEQFPGDSVTYYSFDSATDDA